MENTRDFSENFTEKPYKFGYYEIFTIALLAGLVLTLALPLVRG